MNVIVRNIIATLLGLFAGGVLNGQLVNNSTKLIPLPDGVVMDPNDIEQIKAIMPTLPLQNFIMPFLAHALGTLLAAFIACKLAKGNKMIVAIVVGGLFFIGGIMINMKVGGPIWFIVVDLLIAYFPMALLGKSLAGENSLLPNL